MTTSPWPFANAVDNDEVVCFGDNGLTDLIEGSTIAGTVHDIAGGPPLLQTSFDVRVLVSADVALGTIGEVIGHVRPTGTWEDARLKRRLLGLRLTAPPAPPEPLGAGRHTSESPQAAWCPD